MLREEILGAVNKIGVKKFSGYVFNGLQVGEEEKQALLASLCSGHHLLFLGPPGSGKTAIANRLSTILNDIEVVEDCPLNDSPQDASCPWCLEKKSRGVLLRSRVLPAAERVKKVQGSSGLVAEDLIGDLDPEKAFSEGIYSLSAFVPGKLLRANKGILLIDFIDRVPERVLNTVLYALQGDAISIGAFEQKFALDILVVATGSERAVKSLPVDLLDYFDIIKLGYVDNFNSQKQLTLDYLNQGETGKTLAEATIDKAIHIVDQTRRHSEVERGVGTRGMIKYTELLASLSEMAPQKEGSLLRKGALVSLPHRLALAPAADLPGKRVQIINEIVDQIIGVETAKEEGVNLSAEDIQALVEEIVREDKFRIPLKYGAFDMLLKRVHQFPESKLAQLYALARQKMKDLYPERYKLDNLTDEMLQEAEEERKKRERLLELAAAQEALAEALSFLEQSNILERSPTGFMLGQRGITLLLDRLMPRLEENSLYGYGKHSTGKKLTIGDGEVIGTRHFRFGDRYRDVSFKDTMRQVIRNRRHAITKKDIMVTTKDIRNKMDIVLLLDLSGTMHQLYKLWYAKESAIALSLASAQYGDRVGVVSFSNLADVVVDLTSSPYRVTRRVVDLELHENAFTNIGYGLLRTCELLAHHPKGKAKQHIILISDGDATAPHPSPQRFALRQAARAARKGITISCVCIHQESSDPELMRRIARLGKGRIYLVGAEELTTTLLEETAVARFS